MNRALMGDRLQMDGDDSPPCQEDAALLYIITAAAVGGRGGSLTFQFLQDVHGVAHLQTQLLLATRVIVVDG